MFVFGTLHIVSNQNMWIVCVATCQDAVATTSRVPYSLSLRIVAMDVHCKIILDLKTMREDKKIECADYDDSESCNSIINSGLRTSAPSCSCLVTWRETSIQIVAFFLTALSDNSKQYCGLSPTLNVSSFGP